MHLRVKIEEAVLFTAVQVQMRHACLSFDGIANWPIA